MNQDLASYFDKLGIRPVPGTSYTPWTNGKIDIQNKHLVAHFRNFFEQARGKMDELAPKFANSHNTVPNDSTGISLYEIVLGQKPQMPLTLKLGPLRNSQLTCSSKFGLPLHRHTLQTSKNTIIDKFLQPTINISLLVRENQLKQIYNNAYKRS